LLLPVYSLVFLSVCSYCLPTCSPLHQHTSTADFPEMNIPFWGLSQLPSGYCLVKRKASHRCCQHRVTWHRLLSPLPFWN
jgi:hypothetical protein